MGGRLVLSTVGIKSPLDIAEAPADEPVVTDAGDATPAVALGSRAVARRARPSPRPRVTAQRDAATAADAGGSATAAAPSSRTAARRARPSASSPESSPGSRGADVAPFYGTGPRVQTSVALDGDHAKLLEDLARAGRVSVNALAVAALQAGLPAQSDVAREAIVDERERRAFATSARVERNLRLPVQMRARVDELVAAARERLPRANRADLVNAALGHGLPADAEAAAQLVAQYNGRLERSAAA